MHAPNRLQLSIVASLAAVAAMALSELGQDLGAAIAAVIAVGCIAEAWHRAP
jgi:hypothetical protein